MLYSLAPPCLFALSTNVAATFFLEILPVAPLGMVSTIQTLTGTLNCVKNRNQTLHRKASGNARTFVKSLPTSAIICFSVIRAPVLGTTAAQTASPYILSGTPKDTASLTPSQASSAESTSSGEIFSPPRDESQLDSCFRKAHTYSG